jgi:hypothetical protein
MTFSVDIVDAFATLACGLMFAAALLWPLRPEGP